MQLYYKCGVKYLKKYTFYTYELSFIYNNLQNIS